MHFFRNKFSLNLSINNEHALERHAAAVRQLSNGPIAMIYTYV